MNHICIQHIYNVKKYNMDELNFSWKKVLSNFCMIYNFTITLTKIHFPIYEVQSNNSNPEKRHKTIKMLSNVFKF